MASVGKITIPIEVVEVEPSNQFPRAAVDTAIAGGLGVFDAIMAVQFAQDDSMTWAAVLVFFAVTWAVVTAVLFVRALDAANAYDDTH